MTWEAFPREVRCPAPAIELRLGRPATCDRERLRSQIERVPPRW